MRLEQDNKAVGRLDPAAMCIKAVSLLYIHTTVTKKGPGVYDIVKRGQGYGDAILHACWAIVTQKADKVKALMERSAARSLVSLLDLSRRKISSTHQFLGHEDAGLICGLTEPVLSQIRRVDIGQLVIKRP